MPPRVARLPELERIICAKRLVQDNDWFALNQGAEKLNPLALASRERSCRLVQQRFDRERNSKFGDERFGAWCPGECVFRQRFDRRFGWQLAPVGKEGEDRGKIGKPREQPVERDRTFGR